MQSEYPKILESHKKTLTFNMNDEKFHLRDHLAYYHTDEYPLYMHTHDFYELNIIVEGYGRHYIEDKNYPAEPGSVFAFPPGIRHGYWAQGDNMSIFHLLIGDYIFTKFYKELEQFQGFRFLFETEPLIRRTTDATSLFLHLSPDRLNEFKPKMSDLVKTASETFSGAKLLFEMKAVCLLGDLSFLMSKFHNQKEAGALKNGDIYPLINTIEYMDDNFGNHISLDDLANLAITSKASYLRNFKKFFNTTPFSYLKNLRLKKAREMLKNSQKSIAEISQDCGFFDSSHFIRTFKEMFNCTPTEYQSEHSSIKMEKTE